MAVLGVQIVFSLVTFTFLHKIAPYYSIGRWLLSKRLYRYLHPTNEELKQLASAGANASVGGKSSSQSGKARRRTEQRKGGGDKSESFTVPRNIPLQLDQSPVEDIDLIPLQYYSEYTWLMDFSLCTIVVYILTEIYYIVSPHRIELNLSVLWCLLALAFCIRLLMSQAWIYLKTQDGGERVLLVTFTFFFLVFVMGVLVVGDDIIEFGLEAGYKNFSENAKIFLEKQGSSEYGPMSYLTFKVILAFIGMLIGALLTFPGLRLAKLHLDTLKYNQGHMFLQFILQLNYFLPLIIILLWVRPFGRALLCGKNFSAARGIIYEDQFDGLRLLFILILCAIRLAFMPLFLQSHLNLAYEKVEKMKKESGRITNTELQKMVARVFFYLCVVAVQYIAPVLMILFLTFLLKTLGGLSWVGLFGETAVQFFTPAPKQAMSMPSFGGSESTVGTVMESAANLSSTLGDIRGIFSPVWYQGVLSYLMWWVMTAWFSSASLGIMYYSQPL